MKNRVLSLIMAVCMLAALLAVPHAGAVAYTMEIPDTGADTRQLVVEYAKQLAAVEWLCTEDVDFTNAVYWTPNLYYHAGTTYHGLPYTSDRPANNANLDEFLAQINGNGEYIGPGTWNEMPGSDCGGQVRIAYAMAGVLCDFEMEEVVFDPGELALSCGLIPVGDYDWSGFSRSSSTNKSVLVPNGEAKMWDCYSQLQAGDCLFVLYPDGGEHIMLVTGTPQIVRDGTGRIIPESSMVPILELTSAIHDRGAYKTNWNDLPYSFRSLFDTGFIPMTHEGFSKKSIDAPSFLNENIYIEGKVGFHDLMSGRIVSNYNILTLTAKITDASGATVLEGISYANSLRAELADLNYGAGLLELAAGNYHYTLTAKIGFGEITMVDADITYTGCDGAPVVYISDQGTGNGSSPEQALGHGSNYSEFSLTSYKDCAFVRALEMLSETGGTVVVCGDVTLTSGRGLQRYTQLISPMVAPTLASDQSVVITSNYGGVDYRKSNGAELVLQRSAKQAVDLELKIGSTWQDLDLRVDYNYAMLPAITTSTIGAFLCFDNHKTVINESVNVSLSLNGEALDAQKNAKYFPKLFGAAYNLPTDGDTDLTVLGGTWTSLVGGSHESYIKGGTKLTVGGNAHVYDGIYGGCSNNAGTLCGNVELNITGGTIGGKLIIGGSGAFSGEGYNITMTVTGWPDLSKVRIINAGGGGSASQVVMDLGGFKNGGSNFTAYYNADEFTQIVSAPEPEPLPGQGSDLILVIVIIAVVVAAAAAVAAVILIKKKNAKGEPEKEAQA